MALKATITATSAEIPPLIRQILAKRGFVGDRVREFLYPDYDMHLHDPFLLTDMDAAVTRIVLAIERKERVVVYGDYDIDGITATAVMLEGLAACGVSATSYIPDRFEEGYGINQQALESIKAGGADLVISVDCGITSIVEADWAREHGLDLIITDHHSVPEALPKAIAVINPKRLKDRYPFKELAGVGVAFKLVLALQKRTGRPAKGQEKWLLDLVAMGTICDVVPLVGENRVLAAFGLKVLAKTRRPGLRELSTVGGVNISAVTSRHVGFILGPRMNAAGRLEHANASLDLVTTTSRMAAGKLATELDLLNRQRRQEQERIFEEASERASMYADDPVLVLADKGWSHGVVGIVASKVSEQWQKPTLIGQVLGDTTKGSARSFGGFNMVEALRANQELLAKFGGHAFAAGWTLETEKLGALRAGMSAYWASVGASVGKPSSQVADIIVTDIAMLDWDLMDQLQLLEPYGSGNAEPVFEFRGLRLASVATVGSDGKHLKFSAADSGGRLLDGIAFGRGSLAGTLLPGGPIIVTGRLEKNEFRGVRRIQVVADEISNE